MVKLGEIVGRLGAVARPEKTASLRTRKVATPPIDNSYQRGDNEPRNTVLLEVQS